jgi:hypothetical protein
VLRPRKKYNWKLTFFNNLQDSIIESLYLSFFPDKVDAILSRCRLFFITGMGRSGTAFLANLLDDVPGASVYHENHKDFNALIDAYLNPVRAEKYLDGIRGRIIASRILHSKCEIYGEVNSLLRYHVVPLQNRVNVTLLHLVRDGRMVVRSAMGRKTFTSADKNHTGRLMPLADDPYRERWRVMDRFEKICWYWASTIKYLLQQSLPVVRFEDVLGSYELFHRQLLDPLKIEISYERWQLERDKPQNASHHNTFPAWKDWTKDQQDQFHEICGDVMGLLGYEYR